MDKVYEAPVVTDYGSVIDRILVGPGDPVGIIGPVSSLLVVTHGIGPYTQSLSNITE